MNPLKVAGQIMSSNIMIGDTRYSGTVGNSRISIGTNAGNESQNTGAIAIGNQAGMNGQAANTIVLNSGGDALNTGNQPNALFINPIRSTTAASGTHTALWYDSGNIGTHSFWYGYWFGGYSPTSDGYWKCYK